MKRSKTQILKDELSRISTPTLREMKAGWLKAQQVQKIASRARRIKIINAILINRID